MTTDDPRQTELALVPLSLPFLFATLCGHGESTVLVRKILTSRYPDLPNPTPFYEIGRDALSHITTDRVDFCPCAPGDPKLQRAAEQAAVRALKQRVLDDQAWRVDQQALAALGEKVEPLSIERRTTLAHRKEALAKAAETDKDNPVLPLLTTLLGVPWADRMVAVTLRFQDELPVWHASLFVRPRFARYQGEGDVSNVYVRLNLPRRRYQRAAPKSETTGGSLGGALRGLVPVVVGLVEAEQGAFDGLSLALETMAQRSKPGPEGGR